MFHKHYFHKQMYPPQSGRRGFHPIPGLGRSPGEGTGCLENSMDSIDHEVTKGQTRSHFHFTSFTHQTLVDDSPRVPCVSTRLMNRGTDGFTPDNLLKKTLAQQIPLENIVSPSGTEGKFFGVQYDEDNVSFWEQRLGRFSCSLLLKTEVF